MNEVAQKVGDIVLFNGNKTYGYVIEVDQDMLKLVSDQGKLKSIRCNEIDKVMPNDKKSKARDSMGNELQHKDVVRITNRSSPYFDQRGMIYSICKNYLFLWDRKFMNQSFGIFVENTRNVTLQGTEHFQKDPNQRAAGLVNKNRIQKDKLLNKVVKIINGDFKGHHGTVTHMNGDMATIEISIRAKQVHINKVDLMEIDEEEHHYREQNNYRPD